MLKAGDLLGPYEIVAPLGAGGMGEVYRARDTRLNRTVAIKVLPEQLAGDRQFRERFDREARAISSLDHPHICALYDVGEQNGTAFLVMQYLEGETLADRLQKGALPFGQGIEYAVQIADALDRAHRAGIVHRDLKPGNIMLTKSGAKLLDFGLAKTSAASAASGLSMLPTTPPGLTAQGTILGTFQYMAPEQLEGREADARTDIFAFGAVVYEMLTGRKAFEGKSQASLISAIMSSQPKALSSLQTLAPPALDQLLARCLAKDTDDRWQSARDVKLQLEWVAEPGSTGVGPIVPAKDWRHRIAWAVAASALAGLLLLGGAFALRRAPDMPVKPVQFVVLPPENASFTNDAGLQAVAPDGQQIVFSAAAGGPPVLWLRPLDSLVSRPLAGTEEAVLPFWSPDNRSVGFFARGKLKTVEVAGGSPQTLADAPFALGGTWGRDGVIVFSPNLLSPLLQIPATGGNVKPVSNLNERAGQSLHVGPSFLPDGRRFLFWAGPADPGVYVGSLDSNEAKFVLRSDSAATYSWPGYLLFMRESTVMAQVFDAPQMSATGEPQRVAEEVDRFISQPGFSVSDNGVLVFRPANAGQTELAWFDRTGKRLATVAPAGEYSNFSLSPDENHVAFDRDTATAAPDVWVMDLRRQVTERFTFAPAVDNVPIWSADGRNVIFAAVRGVGLDIYQRSSNASGPDEVLLKLDAPPIMVPSDSSSDGRYLTYYSTDLKTRRDIWALPLSGDRKPFPVVHGEFNETESQFSPDTKWIAYVSDESGTPQIYVQSFPMLTGKWQVSTEGGFQPRWRRDGKELFYLSPTGKLMAVAVKSGATFEAEAPRPLFETKLDRAALRHTYAVSANGTRFLLNLPIEGATPPLTVLLNWPALLKK
jgi:Tol biopolymer transport system component